MVRYAVLLFAVAVNLSAFAQTTPALSTKSKKAIELYTLADNFRVRREYGQAVALLNQALSKDNKFTEAYYRLGLTYFSMKQYGNAIQQFEKGLALAADVNKRKMFWFALGEPYLLAGQYEKAMQVLKLFLDNEKTNRQRIDRATLLYNSAAFALKNKSTANAYANQPLSDSVNQYELQYFPVLTADQSQLIFTRRVTNNPNDDEDLVVSRKSDRGRWLRAESISKKINTPLNEGTCSISADGRKLILTSCEGRAGFGSCDLYESSKVGSDWSEPRNLGRNVNSGAWESQPSLSADGRTLYFVSDRHLGMGLRDIWISTLDEQGNWTRAINAGPAINSQYDEISPFIHANNRTLFFATNGRPGFGGYDIFSVERNGEEWTEPVNLGQPVNDLGDQFSLFVTADGLKGYYSHEETMSNGESRSWIYETTIPKENQVRYRSNYVKGVIRDKVSREPLRANIELINLRDEQVVSLVTSDSVSGEYLMILTQGAEYALYITRKGYLFRSYHFNYSAVTDFQPIVIDIDLEKAMAGSVAVLNNLFFDVDKYELKEMSGSELQKVVRFLKDNPAMRVEIGGHTDNSGSARHNRELSEKRAQSVNAFLVAQGIPQTQLRPKGYGPDQPVASNDTEEGRQQNRRIEFRILH